MKRITFFIFILTLVACSGNTGNGNDSSKNQAQLPENYTVNVYQGTLPCADCQGVITKLTLFQNIQKNQYTYRLQEEYIGQANDKTFETNGKWIPLKGTPQDPNAIVYQLMVPNDDPEDPDVINYQVVDKNTIKMIDAEMNEFDSKSNYNLKRAQN